MSWTSCLLCATWHIISSHTVFIDLHCVDLDVLDFWSCRNVLVRVPSDEVRSCPSSSFRAGNLSLRSLLSQIHGGICVSRRAGVIKIKGVLSNPCRKAPAATTSGARFLGAHRIFELTAAAAPRPRAAATLPSFSTSPSWSPLPFLIPPPSSGADISIYPPGGLRFLPPRARRLLLQQPTSQVTELPRPTRRAP